MIHARNIRAALCLALSLGAYATALAGRPAVPDSAELRRSFSKEDEKAFRQPGRIYYPETWFHFINGNIRRESITRDLEAIAASGIQGVQFFHGQVGTPTDWPGTEEHIECLSPKWEDLVRHTAEEAHRLGLRFSLQTCPGWATSGGPWIKPEQAMRHLSYSRTDIEGGREIVADLPVTHKEDWRDWRDIAVLAFPTPEGDTGSYCQVEEVQAEEYQQEWQKLLGREPNSSFALKPTEAGKPHRLRIRMKQGAKVRSVEFNPIDRFNHAFSVQPDIHLRISTPGHDVLLDTDFPHANWQDNERTMTFALPDTQEGGEYILEITNLHTMQLSSLRFSSAARGNNWEMEAGWTLRWLIPLPADMNEDGTTFIQKSDIVNLSEMTHDGKLHWKAPEGKWTVLRIGHINTGRRNGPAPAEATGWEVNKLDTAYVSHQFRSYIGRLTDGPLKGLVDNMLMDSWECSTQTWTRFMPQEFQERRGYDLTQWLPAIFGWVIDGRQQTSMFLSDWRRTINDLFVNNFYGHMSHLAHEKGMTVSYETAAGDIFPGDPLEFYKHADVPMAEYWQPFSHWLANHNYKPIRATASAARMYGKSRVSAESFTSFGLTWDEHLSMLREVANQNMVEGITHTVFHTYTHNPDADRYFPGTSFGGSRIGTPFLRKQTWWPFMHHFNTYLARCAFMLERGRPVSSVLWYIGDQIEQKPDQYAPFPEGFAYDYCNTDALLHRIKVRNGHWTTPEGIRYDVLWIPDTHRLLPETLTRLQLLEAHGGRIIRNVPLSELGRALERHDLKPDVMPTSLRWLHRQTDKADWYMVCPQKEQAFSGEVSFRQRGRAELWNPMNGSIQLADAEQHADYTRVRLDLQRGEMLFVVFRHDAQPKHKKKVGQTEVITPDNWTLTFPEGWGIEAPVQLTELKAWKDLPLGDEGRAFSGTATYETSIHTLSPKKGRQCLLRLGEVEEIAVVKVNGAVVDTLWAAPYQTDITSHLRRGSNIITIEVTSTWFNRLVYDAGLPQERRRTWVIDGPSAKEALRPSGLLGPVEIVM